MISMTPTANTRKAISDMIYSPMSTIAAVGSNVNSNGKSPSNSNRPRANSGGSAIQNSPSNYDDDDDDRSYYDNENSHHFAEEEEFHDGENVGAVSDFAPRRESNPKAKAARQFDLCGTMWKRRGGLGRNADRNWVRRCFTLCGPILCYHEESDIELVADPSKPRARLNLGKIETIGEMHSKQMPSLPTEYLLTINIYAEISHAKKKWEMCCTSKEQQLIWYKAIKAYDGKPDAGTASSNTTQGDPDSAVQTRRLTLDPISDKAESRVRSSLRGMDDTELIAKAASMAAEMLYDKQSDHQKESSGIIVALSIVVLNVAVFLARNGSDQIYKMTVLFMNAYALCVAFKIFPKSNSPKRGPKACAAESKGRIRNEGKSHSMVDPEKRSQNLGVSIPHAAPKRNSELERRLKNHKLFSAESVRAYAAASLDSIEPKPHSYASIDAKMFKLRVGPNYKKNKQKAPSGRALYDLVSMDFLYLDTPLRNTTDRFHIPSIPGITDVSTGHAHIPPMLIINTWLPGEEPSMFSKNNDGGTYSIPMVFVLSQDTIEQLKCIDSASPSVKLLSEWCRQAEKDSDFRGRFKCMGIIENIESTNVPKFIQGYNGKPALVTKSGNFKRYSNYIEFTINVNMWAYLARKGLFTLTPTFPDFIFNIGFTIEARKDDEMPEVLLGGCRLLNLDPSRAAVDDS